MDLKIVLTLRMVGVAIISLLLMSVFFVAHSNHQSRQTNIGTAEKVGSQLEMQLLKIRAGIDLSYHYPDLYPLIDGAAAIGSCIHILGEDQQVLAGECWGRTGRTAPEWFASLYTKVFENNQPITRPIRLEGHPKGSVMITPDMATTIVQAWDDTGRSLSMSAATLLLLCTLAYWAIASALHPTKQILSGLGRLADGDFSTRLPPFRLIELERISQVFNQMAANLETTTKERTELASRLVSAQEEERRHLARELHDEFGQNLAAINALASSIRQSTNSTQPELAAEAHSITNIVMAMMETMRTTQERLRPFELDELGLPDAIRSLAEEWNRRLKGQMQFVCDIDDRCTDLPMPLCVNLYRIAQECVTNAIKHSQATHVMLSLKILSSEHAVKLKITDNGTTQDSRQTHKESAGVIGMNERAMALGGQLKVAKASPTGTTVWCQIPIGTA